MPISKYVKLNKQKRLDNPFSMQSGRFNELKFSSKGKLDWSEDVFFSEGGSKETVGRDFNFFNIYLMAGAIGFFVIILLLKVAWLQIYKGEYYYGMAEGNRIRIQRVEPKRGIIYDRGLRPLVRNKPNFLLYITPADLPFGDENEKVRNGIIDKIADILLLNKNDIQKKIDAVDRATMEVYNPIFIADNIDYEIAMRLYLETENWPGVILDNKISREYLTPISTYLNADDEELKSFGFSLSHVLGYIGKISPRELERFSNEYRAIDYIGKMGIEYFWENELKGMSGKKQIEVDAFGKEKKVIGEELPIDGNNLVLSLDIDQQVKLEEILLEHLTKLGLSKASAVVMNPNNGEVLAMVSLPSYNNNIFARGITQKEYNVLLKHPDNPMINRVISGQFPSGSVFKIVMAAAALQEKIISESTSFFSSGGIGIGEWFFPDWKAGGHGRTNVKKAIAQSVNTFFYYIGGGFEDFVGLGVDKIVNYGKMFGLGSQTGIDLAGEKSGLLPTREWKKEVKDERWYVGDTYHLAIGQGDLIVTPLQVANFTSVIANGGALYRPHFIKMVLDGDDNILKETEVVPVRDNFIDDYNIEVVRKGMRLAVSSSLGSARRLQSVPVAVSGKTGTAQWSSKKENHAWFTGFAPYDDTEIVVTVLIEEGGEGSSAAVPVAEDFLKWYFTEYKSHENEELK